MPRVVNKNKREARNCAMSKHRRRKIAEKRIAEKRRRRNYRGVGTGGREGGGQMISSFKFYTQPNYPPSIKLKYSQAFLDTHNLKTKSLSPTHPVLCETDYYVPQKYVNDPRMRKTKNLKDNGSRWSCQEKSEKKSHKLIQVLTAIRTHYLKS